MEEDIKVEEEGAMAGGEVKDTMPEAVEEEVKEEEVTE